MFADLMDKDIQPRSMDIEHIPEFSISNGLKQEIEQLLRDEEKSFVKVFEHSAVVQTDKNYVFFSNHWLYLAVVCKKYAEALRPYADFFNKNIRRNLVVLKRLAHKQFDAAEVVDLIPDSIDRGRMVKFIMSDPDFRPGKCLINGEDGDKVRGTKDIMGSCILKKIPVPDASSAYLGNLICNLTNSPSVYANLEAEINAQLQNTIDDATNTGDAVSQINFCTSYQSDFERNRILFGAPGTGKSYTLNKERKELLGDGNEYDYERVTFHPDYSYANFVGTYKPVSITSDEGKEMITYKYVPGPFMRLYVKALKNAQSQDVKPFLLIIEEINRANVAAVFGDIFQLLDRGDDGVSEYPIQASEDIKKYLCSELGGNPEDYEKIRIPDNMFIWATMNSADQGVFPMDTAFKRRWDFTYLGVNDSDEQIRGKYVYLAADKSQKVEWNKLRKAINNFLAKQKINEDKQLGPYFISKNIVVPENGDEIDRDKFIRVFKNKVIMYLFEDAARQKRPSLFEGCSQNSGRYSEICRAFEAGGIKIFNTDIQNESELEDMTSRSEGNE